MNFRKSLFVFAIGLFLSPLGLAEELSVTSPDGDIVFKISDEGKRPQYRVFYRGEQVLDPSNIGFTMRKLPDLGDESFKLVSHKRGQNDSQWEQPWGERKIVRDHHKELLVNFERGHKPKHKFSLRIRVFNDGLGFRYEVPKQRGMKSVEIVSENTEFVFPKPKESTAWWIPSRGWNRYEYDYNTTALTEVVRAHTPMTLKLSSGVHISVHEAALVDFAGMTLDQRRPGTFNADLTPWSDGVAVKTKVAFKSPWRTLQIADNAVGLLNSDLILNLNEPNKLGDVSWVKPGKYVGIWWGMHLKANTWGSGDIHGATTSETMRYMDFAAKHGFVGVLVEGWNIGWDGDWYSNGDIFDFTKSFPDFDLEKVTTYGKTKNVELIGHHETSGSVTNYRTQMGDAFDLYQKHGVTRVKTGYVTDGGRIKRIDDDGIARYEWHDGQFMVNEYLHSVTEAAKRKISVNTHEPVKDTGLRRTYPNWVSREGARGQEYNAWGSPPNPPEHTAILPFTRMLSGPMDFTPGIFDLSFDGLDAENRVKTTLAKQLALYVVIYTPLQMAADLPKNYDKNPEAFQFIVDVPVDWEESIALAGEVGDYIVIARQERDAKDWYLGALTDENARNISVDLDFLTKGQKYRAEIYRDGLGANWKTAPYKLTVESRVVRKGDTLKFSLATSGGVAVRFEAL